MFRIDDQHTQQARSVPIEQVWARLGLPLPSPGVTFRSPFRQDDHPSCQLGGAKNIFFDHGLGEALDTIELVRKVRSCEFPEAVAFALDRPLSDIQPAADKGVRPASAPVVDGVEELARVRRWSLEALRALGAQSKPACAPREVIFPMRDAKGNLIGTRLRRADGLKYSDGSKVRAHKGSKQGLMYPHPLPEEGPDGILLIVEGEADAAAALTAGWKVVVATPGAAPSKACLQQLQLLAARRKVVLFPDPDDAGRHWRENIGQALLNACCQVALVPPLGEDDLDKRLRQEKEPAAALAQWIAAALPFEPAPGPKAKSRTSSPAADQCPGGLGNPEANTNSDPPPSPAADSSGRYRPLEIMINSRQLRHIIVDAWGAVHHYNRFHANAATQSGRPAGPRVFQRSGSLVRLKPGCAGAEAEIQLMSEKMIYALITRVADWKRITKEGKADAMPVKDVAADMLVALGPGLPLLDGVVVTPVFGRGGQLIQAHGYHPGERLWHEPDPALSVPPIAEHPGLGEIAAARSLLLDELLVDFPMAAPSDRAHILAALLLPFVRRLIEGPTPLHLLEAPSAGSGKGLLANVISTIVTGRAAPGQVLSAKDDEARKQLTAEMVRGRPLILIDNVSEKLVLDSPALASIVTATLWTDRVLGLSQMVTAPNQALWLMTGNNPRLSMELARRCVRVRLQPQVDRPWLRGGFRHDPLLKWVGQQRGELMRAILTLIQAWVVAGQPRGQKRLGSFEQWAEVIGGILQVAGVEGFLDNLEEYYAAADQEGQDWREFTAAWWERWQAAPCTVGQLTEFCVSQELMSMARGEGSPRSQQTRLGNALAQARDRVFGGLQLRRVERTHHRAGSSWQLTLLEEPADVATKNESMDEATPELSEEEEVVTAKDQALPRVRMWQVTQNGLRQDVYEL